MTRTTLESLHALLGRIEALETRMQGLDLGAAAVDLEPFEVRRALRSARAAADRMKGQLPGNGRGPRS